MTTTDLGIVRVRSSVLRNGATRDVLFLAHNNLRVCTITCDEKKTSQLVVNPEFYAYENAQFLEVGKVYLEWKRRTAPGFKMQRWSKKSSSHPWAFHKAPGGAAKRGEPKP